MLPQHHAITRIVSLANATKLVRTLPYRTIVSSSKNLSQGQSFSRMTEFFNNNNHSHIAKTANESLATRYNLSKAFTQYQHFRNFTSGGVQSFQRQAPRGFSHQRAALLTRNALTKSPRSSQATQPYQLRAYSQQSGKRRRPLRFVLKTMLISTALIALVVLPAVFVYGAPVVFVLFIALAVESIVGGALFLSAAGFLFFVIPITLIGGVITFWFFAMPAAVTTGDLNKIIKRAKKEVSTSLTPALAALGPDWEIQKSKPDEWFQWKYPRNKKELDKISIRMAVFDPNDNSDRKNYTAKWIESITDKDAKHSSSKKRNASFQFRNQSANFSINDFVMTRENDHVLIKIEDDGAKLLSQKWGQRYLDLAKIVGRAATELESTQPGLKLGNQIVLVRKESSHSFWNKFSLCGDINLRIPFDRTWIHDVTDDE
ncbi:hypothetical protein BGZ46_001990 [Entomortierella lignicola]|nr:hypothetical protein BGZ46_001990 [Entomortierella lignicola]